MPVTAAGFAALFAYLQTPRYPPRPEDPDEPPDDIMFAYVVDEVRQSHSGSPDTGDGGVPALAEWLRSMEVAFRWMTVSA
jgi:hypothetical protein